MTFQRVPRFFQSRLFQRICLVVVLLSGLIGVATELYVTREGAGVAGDSVHYLQGATNLLAGKGYSRLRGDGTALAITGFPPMFSIALAGLSSLGFSAFEASRWLNAVLMGVNTALISLLVYRAGRSGLLAILGGWLYMYADNVVRVHAWVMSEPLFITLSLSAMLALDVYLKGEKRWALALASLAIGLASLTRYAGLALVPAAGLAVLLVGPAKGLRRWLDAFLVGLIGLLPVALWFGRNAAISGSLANRAMGYHPISKDLVFTFFNEIAFYWFAPSLSLPWRLRLALLMFFIAAGLGMYIAAYIRTNEVRRKGGRSSDASCFSFISRGRPDAPSADVRHTSSSPLPGLIAIYGFFYLVLLAVNTTFLDASTDEPGIKRYAIPLLAVGIIWTLTSFSQMVWSHRSQLVASAMIFLVGLGLVIFYASDSVPFILHPGYAFGYTDTRRGWTCEVEIAKSIDAHRLILTNDYELFYFLADRPAYLVPKRFDNYQAKVVEDFDVQMDSVKEMLRGGAVLTALGNPDEYSREINGLVADMGLEVWRECSHARFYVEPAHVP